MVEQARENWAEQAVGRVRDDWARRNEQLPAETPPPPPITLEIRHYRLGVYIPEHSGGD